MSHTSSRFTFALSLVILTFLFAAALHVASAVKAVAHAPQNSQQTSGCDKVAFVSGSSLYVINSDGTGQTPLGGDTPMSVSRAEISPNGRLIAFVARSGSTQPDLYIMNSDGTGLLQLTRDLESFNYEFGALAFSSDSSKITFMAERGTDGFDGVHTINADGTGLLLLSVTETIDAKNPRFNPAGTKIVFEGGNHVNGRDIFLVNADGSGEVANLTFKLGEPHDFGSPAYKPDGARIVFSGKLDGEDDYDIFAIAPDGSARARLTDTDADEFSPAYSPDGNRIIYTALSNDKSDVYAMNADSTDKINLSDNPASDGSPVFSPDGRTIIFVSNRDDGETFQLYSMNAVGANQVRLTDGEFSAFNPSIAFVDRDADGVGDPCDNCQAVANPDQLNTDNDLQGDLCDDDDDNDDVPDSFDNCPLNKNANQVDNEQDGLGDTCDPDDDNDRTPDASDNCPFSANGYPIAFASRRDGNLEIYKMSLNGTGVTRLTNRTSIDDEPSFSSDGSRILFTSNRFNSRQEIYAMESDGSPVTRLTNIAGGNRTAVFSPDGTRIAFVSTRDDGKRSVYVMDSDGTNQTRLTFAQGFSGTADNPTFNHDGTRIAFESDRGSVGQANQDIFTINPDGSGELRLTTATGKDSDPAYSRDGSKIVFVSERNGNREIYVMNHDGSNQTRLTTNTVIDRQPAFTPDGKAIAFTSNRNGDDELFLMNPDGTGVTPLTSTLNENIFPSLAPQLDADNDGVGDSCDPSITTTINPIADTWVQGAEATRDTNYGADTSLQIKRTLNPGAGRGRRGFLKFDFSQVTATVSSVRLKVFGSLTDASLPPTAMIVQKVTDTTWDEMTMTWNNQPPTASPNALAQITVAGATGAWYEFDLTAFIEQERAEGRSVISLRLINQAPTGNSGAFYTRINSREAAQNKPQLVIEQ